MFKLKLCILGACLISFFTSRAQTDKPKEKIDKAVLNEGAKADVYRMDKAIFDSSVINQKPVAEKNTFPIKKQKKMLKKKHKRKAIKKISK